MKCYTHRYNNPQLNGEDLYWHSDCVRNRNADPNDDYTKEDYNAYLKAFIKLSTKYTSVVVSERWNLFIKASGITGSSTENVTLAAELFDDDNQNSVVPVILNNHWIAFKPVFKNIRKAVIYLFGGRDTEGIEIRWIKMLMWNAIIPIVFLLFIWIHLVTKKNWYPWIAGSFVLSKLIIIILTEPTGWWMYLLTYYLIGNVVFIFGLWKIYSKKYYNSHIESSQR